MITSSIIPHNFRNKYLRNGGSGTITTTTQSEGGGGSVEYAENARRANSADTATFATSATTATSAITASRATTATGADKLNNNVNVYGNTWNGTTDLTNISSTTINNSDTITTKNLNVTGQATFLELVIDKIKSVGGSALFTPAEGFTVNSVRQIGTPKANCIEISWSRDNTNPADVNMWEVGDMALCMNFNSAKQGYDTSARNKYWWALVVAKKTGASYHSITISTDDGEYDGNIWLDGTLQIEAGDDIVQCGHKKQTGETDDHANKRGNAIYIAASNSLDSGLTAPLYAQYKAIKTFALAPYRKTYLDATGANFVGNFKVSSGEDIEDILFDLNQDLESVTLKIDNMPDGANVLYNDDPIHEEIRSADLSYFKGVNGSMSAYTSNEGYTYQPNDQIATAAFVTDDTNVECPYEDGRIMRLTLNGKNYLNYGNNYETIVRGNYLSAYWDKMGYKNCDSDGWVKIKPNKKYTLTVWYCLPNKPGVDWWSLANSWNFKFDLRAYCQNSNHNLVSPYYVFANNTTKMTDIIKEPNKFYPITCTFTTTNDAHYFNLGIGFRFTAPANTSNSYSPTVYFCGYKLEEGGTSTGNALDYAPDDQSLFDTGIDIIDKTITLTADNLICKNNSGTDNLKLDSNGNLTVRGTINADAGEFKGDITTLFNDIRTVYPDTDTTHYGITGSTENFTLDCKYTKLKVTGYYHRNTNIILPTDATFEGKEITIYNGGGTGANPYDYTLKLKTYDGSGFIGIHKDDTDAPITTSLAYPTVLDFKYGSIKLLAVKDGSTCKWMIVNNNCLNFNTDTQLFGQSVSPKLLWCGTVRLNGTNTSSYCIDGLTVTTSLASTGTFNINLTTDGGDYIDFDDHCYATIICKTAPAHACITSVSAINNGGSTPTLIIKTYSGTSLINATFWIKIDYIS